MSSFMVQWNTPVGDSLTQEHEVWSRIHNDTLEETFSVQIGDLIDCAQSRAIFEEALAEQDELEDEFFELAINWIETISDCDTLTNSVSYDRIALVDLAGKLDIKGENSDRIARIFGIKHDSKKIIIKIPEGFH